MKIDRSLLTGSKHTKTPPKIFLKKTSTHQSLWSSGDVSEGEDSDFEGDGVYSYRSDAFGAISNIEELNSSPLPAIASGDEEPLSSDSEWLPSFQQDTTAGKSICQVEYRKVNVCSYVEHSPLNLLSTHFV